MRQLKRFGLYLSLLLLLGASPLYAQQKDEQLQTVVLFSKVRIFSKGSPAPYIGQQSSIRFEANKDIADNKAADLTFGAVFVFGDESDWLSIRVCTECRTVIKDLGKKKWTDRFNVPKLKPLPELKPGERRTVVIDTSGKNGGNGPNGLGGTTRTNMSEFWNDAGNRDELTRGNVTSIPSYTPVVNKSKNINERTKVANNNIKVKVGHIYAVHVVEGDRDFYVLFRVEEVKHAESCTITWKKVAR